MTTRADRAPVHGPWRPSVSPTLGELTDATSFFKGTSMICIGQEFLRIIGFDTAEITTALNTPDSHGFAVSALHSFDGGGWSGRDTAALDAESEPRRLVLVGMADPYEAGARRATVEKLCVNESGPGAREPTTEEATRIFAELAPCESHPTAALVRQRIRARMVGPAAPQGIANC